MTRWRNSTGEELSSETWLRTHHEAKLDERRAFVARLAEFKPRRVVDVGCGIGLWLELYDEALETDCELIGLDSDEMALRAAGETLAAGRHAWRTQRIDFNDLEALRSFPRCDLMSVFNVFPYMSDPGRFLHFVFEADLASRVVIRQYDGATIRLGPIPPEVRRELDDSIAAGIAHLPDFRHYDLDRTYEAIRNSSFEIEHLEFETFQRFDPFDAAFERYFVDTAEWMSVHASEIAHGALNGLLGAGPEIRRYFVATDLVAVLKK